MVGVDGDHRGGRLRCPFKPAEFLGQHSGRFADVGGGERLKQVMDGGQPDCLACHLKIRIRTDNHTLYIREILPQTIHQLDSGHIRHPDIGNNRIRADTGGFCDGLTATLAACHDRKSFLFPVNNLFHSGQCPWFIINQHQPVIIQMYQLLLYRNIHIPVKCFHSEHPAAGSEKTKTNLFFYNSILSHFQICCIIFLYKS